MHLSRLVPLLGDPTSFENKSEIAKQEDPFHKIAFRILEELTACGGKADYAQFENWAEIHGIGKYTLRTVINDMVEDGRLRAPEGYLDNGEELEPPAPKVIERLNAPLQDIALMKCYLREYWSVGLIRLFEDMGKSGIKDVNEVLKVLLQEGSAELVGPSVINATGKLLKDTKVKQEAKLSELVKF
jgi:hypothetical protein